MCVLSLGWEWALGVFCLGSRKQPTSQIQLEDDGDGVLDRARECWNLKPAEEGESWKSRLSSSFFFRPVEGNMTHHTILGEQPVPFDFICQPIEVVDAEFTGDGSLSSVTIGLTRGKPMTCVLVNIPFDTLSRSLNVWSDFDSDFLVTATLSLDKVAEISFVVFSHDML